jgi:uncharacterized protein YbaR (Trm112 family)
MQELLDVLCCPESHQRFQIAEANFVADLNAKIKAGQVRDRAGKVVSEAIDGALIREDRKYIYVIRNNIPVLLVNEAIPL